VLWKALGAVPQAGLGAKTESLPLHHLTEVIADRQILMKRDYKFWQMEARV
jgi:hypothetical protein